MEQLRTAASRSRILRFLFRQSPWLLALALVASFLPLQTAFHSVMLWAYGAAPIVAGGPDLDGAQVAAEHQASWVPLGVIISKLGAAVFFFFIGVGLTWFTMGKIMGVLPTWAKQDFSTSFLNLPTEWKFGVYVACWLGLLYFFASCLHSASLVQ